MPFLPSFPHCSVPSSPFVFPLIGMYILRFLTSVPTLYLSQGNDTGPLLVKAAENGCLLTVQYLLEQVLMFLTKPVLTELVRTECIFPSSQSQVHHTISPHLTSHHTSLCTELGPAVLQQGTDVDTLDKYMRMPLIVAAKRGHLEATRMLLENGAEVFHEKVRGERVFLENHPEVLALLEVRATVCPSLFSFYPLYPFPPSSGSSSLSYVPVFSLSYTSLILY